MPYITEGYYIDTFKGLMPAVQSDLSVLIDRSSDVIDMVTQYSINKELSEYNLLIETQVKKATAVQVMYFISNGGYEDIFSNVGEAKSEKIGSFSYDQGNNEGSKLVCPTVFAYLQPTGLLYSGIGVKS